MISRGGAVGVSYFAFDAFMSISFTSSVTTLSSLDYSEALQPTIFQGYSAE